MERRFGAGATANLRATFWVKTHPEQKHTIKITNILPTDQFVYVQATHIHEQPAYSQAERFCLLPASVHVTGTRRTFIMSGSTRLYRNEDEINQNGGNNVVTPAPPKWQRTSQRNWNYCQDINGLPAELFCSGCKLVKDSSAKKSRSEYKSPKFVCCQGWRKDENKERVGMQQHIKLIKQWIADHANLDCNAAFGAAVDVPEPKAISFVTPPPTTTTKRKLRLCQQTVRS